MQHTYLITAPSGNIGRRLVPLLLGLQSSPTVVLVTSNATRLASTLPSVPNKSRLHVVEGDIQNPEFVEATLNKYSVTGVFLCLTGDNELFTTLNFFDAIKLAPTVKHLVYVSACGDYSVEAMQNGFLRIASAAHVVVKFMTEAKLRHGVAPRDHDNGFSWTILGPTMFFDNDMMSKQGMLENSVFEAPLGSKGLSRVDPGDIALAAAKSFEDDGNTWHGKKVMIGSLQTYTNNDVARLWSQALGKEIRPTMSDLDSLKLFEAVFTRKIGPAWARDLRLMYEMFEEVKFDMTESEYRDQVALLGKEPESYETFVQNTAESWK